MTTPQMPEHPDTLHSSFARAMNIASGIGLAAMIVAGIAYLAGIRPATDRADCAANWHLSATEYWEQATGAPADGYAWFLNDLSRTDNLVLLAIGILVLVPILSLSAALPHADKVYRILIVLVLLEFLFIVLRPIFL